MIPGRLPAPARSPGFRTYNSAAKGRLGAECEDAPRTPAWARNRDNILRRRVGKVPTHRHCNVKDRVLGHPRPDHVRSLSSKHEGILGLLQGTEHEPQCCGSALAESSARWRNSPFGKGDSSILRVGVRKDIIQ